MFFGLISLNLALYIVAVLLFREGENGYAWLFLGTGVLLSVLIIVLYHRRKKNRDLCDGWDYPCGCDFLFYFGCDSLFHAIDCGARKTREGGDCSDCDCSPWD